MRNIQIVVGDFLILNLRNKLLSRECHGVCMFARTLGQDGCVDFGRAGVMIPEVTAYILDPVGTVFKCVRCRLCRFGSGSAEVFKIRYSGYFLTVFIC